MPSLSERVYNALLYLYPSQFQYIRQLCGKMVNSSSSDTAKTG